MSQSSSLSFNFVGVLTPLVACSVSAWRTAPHVSQGKGETGLLTVCTFFSHRRLEGN